MEHERPLIMCNCKNVGGMDRIARALIGVVALVLAYAKFGVMDASPIGIILGVVGVVMLLTALVGFCPLYLPLKLSTCRVK